MKKIVTLVLAIALLMTSVMAFAEGTPNVNSFATLKTKYNESNHIITITLSKPVDRLLVKWAEKGAEPEELAVGEDLKATALTWGHKYMPGTSQYYATWGSSVTYEGTEEYLGVDVDTSERVYEYTGSQYVDGWDGAPVVTEYNYGPEREIDYGKLDEQVAEYLADYGFEEDDCIIIEPYKYTNANGEEVEVKGSIQGFYGSNKYINSGFQTVTATPAQTAFMTVQGEWAVYYNRAGKIVGIEKFDGQF